jgi:hypothetical protein
MRTLLWFVLSVGFFGPSLATAEVDPASPPRVTFEQKKDGVEIRLDGKTVANYVAHDEKIPRPYFAHVKTPSGIQVTRNYPPVKGVDPEDHATLHPGMWMSFADLGGRDFWRNKCRVVEEKRVKKEDAPTIEVSSKYLDGETVIARDTTQFTILPRAGGYLLMWDTTITPQIDGLWMGDQEEMGVGVRVATGLAVKSGKGGHITSSSGGRNEAGTWGKTADWCDYSGTIDGKSVGVMLMSHPANDRKPWFHTRDYGLMVANSFGKRAGAPEKLALEKGKPLRLQFGVLVHENKEGTEVDLAREYQTYCDAAK